MSTVDLMLLGALMEKPMNAYEMKRIMAFRNINSWVKISSPSIYKNLVLLKKRGYLDSEIVKEGEMPEKTIYSVNDKGRNYFMHMMKKYSEEPAMVYIDFVAFVSNLYHVEPNIGIEMIGSLRNKLAEERAYIQQNIKEKKEFVPFHALSILELYDQMYSLFSDWIEKIAQEYAAVNNL